jgi:hypothetical protein
MVEVPLGTSIHGVQSWDALIGCTSTHMAHIHWMHLLGAPLGTLGCLGCTCWVWHFGCNTIGHWMVNEQVMKGVEAPSSIVKVGDVGTWVHLGLEGLASARQVLYK